jgi:RimJ/RimL family protein N-acetyltransferase
MTQPTQSLATEVFAQQPRERCIPILETERLTLRAPRLADVKAIAHFANDRRVAENTTRIPHPYRADDAEQFLTAVNRQDGEATFAIVLGGALIGMCGVMVREGKAEVGYWLGVPHWGHGYATEAARAVIDHAFGDLGHDTLDAGARVSNPASRRVLEKCGFQWTGVGLYRILAIKSSAPLDRFRLDRGLWASLKTWGRAREVA